MRRRPEESGAEALVSALLKASSARSRFFTEPAAREKNGKAAPRQKTLFPVRAALGKRRPCGGLLREGPFQRPQRRAVRFPARLLTAATFTRAVRPGKPRQSGREGPGRGGGGAGPELIPSEAGRGREPRRKPEGIRPGPHLLPLRLDVPRQCRMLSCATGIRTVADSAKRMRTWAKASLSSNLPPR